jgi:hypothetical protein
MNEIHIKIGNNNLFVKGTYYKAEEDVGLPRIFEIESIEPMEKDIYDLLEIVSEKGWKYMQELEELCIEQIENE